MKRSVESVSSEIDFLRENCLDAVRRGCIDSADNFRSSLYRLEINVPGAGLYSLFERKAAAIREVNAAIRRARHAVQS